MRQEKKCKRSGRHTTCQGLEKETKKSKERLMTAQNNSLINRNSLRANGGKKQNLANKIGKKNY